MPVEHPSTQALIDVLDRVLDKGIVVDEWVRPTVIRIDSLTIEGRVVVASIETYLLYSHAVAQPTAASPPSMEQDAKATSVTSVQRDARGVRRRVRRKPSA